MTRFQFILTGLPALALASVAAEAAAGPKAIDANCATSQNATMLSP